MVCIVNKTILNGVTNCKPVMKNLKTINVSVLLQFLKLVFMFDYMLSLKHFDFVLTSFRNLKRGL